MAFLSLLHRELVVAGRHPVTWWTRVVLGGIAGVFTLGVALFVSNPAEMGRAQFSILSFIAFAGALLAGVRYSALTLGQEIREGTLGLLMLTSLKRTEIVFGKVAGSLVEAASSLLVLVPLMSLPILSGGVGLWDVALVTAMLLCTLIISLCAGLCISAGEPDEIKAMLMTGLFLGLLCIPLGWIAFVVIKTRHLMDDAKKGEGRSATAMGLILLLWLPVLVGIVPAYLSWNGEVAFWSVCPARWFYDVQASPPPPWWVHAGHLVQIVLAAVALLALAARRISPIVVESFLPDAEALPGSREVQSERSAPAAFLAGLPAVPRPKSDPAPAAGEANEATSQPLAERRPAVRLKHRPPAMLESRPIEWLLSPQHWLRQIVWLTAILLGFLQLRGLISAVLNYIFFDQVFWFALIIRLAWQFLIAWQAAHFFGDGRSNGSLEMVLVTPLSRKEIVVEQWSMLHGLFLRPVGAVCLFSFLAVTGSLLHTRFGRPTPEPLWLVCLPLITAAGFFLSYLAHGWFGMWRAWCSPRPRLAAFQTVLLVTVTLSAAQFLISVMFSGFFAGNWFWVGGVIHLALLALVALWARRCFLRSFLSGESPPVLRHR